MNAKTIKIIESERLYQAEKWRDKVTGCEPTHNVAEWLFIMRKLINDAERAWWENGAEQALHEIRQVSAVGVAAIEQYQDHVDLFR